MQDKELEKAKVVHIIPHARGTAACNDRRAYPCLKLIHRVRPFPARPFPTLTDPARLRVVALCTLRRTLVWVKEFYPTCMSPIVPHPLNAQMTLTQLFL